MATLTQTSSHFAYASDAAALKFEISNLIEHNQGLTREILELRKEKAAWKETAKQAHQLDQVVTALHSEMITLQNEAARLRRQNEDFEKKLELEIADNADARSRWAEKERTLLGQLKAERSKVRELKALSTIKTEPGFDSDEADTLAVAPELAPRRNSSPSPSKAESALKEENQKLSRHILELNVKVAERDAILEKQTADILELQRTVAALMDDIENSYEQAQFDLLGEVSPPASPSSIPNRVSVSSLTDITMPPAAAAPAPAPAEETTVASETPSSASGKKGRNRSKSAVSMSKSSSHNPQLVTKNVTASSPNEMKPPSPKAQNNVSFGTVSEQKEQLHVIKPMKSFHSLAEELRVIGEQTPTGFASLKSRMAALGLNTEGNREVLKRRLHKYIARKKRQAEARAAAREL